MFAQFFGSYLLAHQAVSPDELIAAISMLADTHIKLGTLAMHMGYMTSSEVDEVCFLQTREDKRFGDIALERNYLFQEQLDEIVKAQIPDYLLLGQTLVDMGCLNNTSLEELMIGYQNESQLSEEAAADENTETTTKLLSSFFKKSNREINEFQLMYMNLIFNNLIRFIGEDFTPLEPVYCTEYDVNYCVKQSISGPLSFISRLDMTTDVAIAFASRYAKMEFTEFDEYVQASLEDFLNLHNGLFSVNMSNSYSKELQLDPPSHEDTDVLSLPENSFVIPVIYPFGTIYLLLTM